MLISQKKRKYAECLKLFFSNEIFEELREILLFIIYGYQLAAVG